MIYRANLSDMLREQYEFKTKKETYLGISIKESEDLKKVLRIVIFTFENSKIKNNRDE